DKIREDWKAFGQPTFVFACPTCKLMFGRHLPEVQGVFLYDLLLEHGAFQAQPERAAASVFDPCASRDEQGLQQTVRALAEKAGFDLAPLPMEGRLAQCCSWGGQVAVANPPYTQYVVKERISEGPHPYIVYCSNCRDVFAKAGKPTWHILDLLLGLNGPDRLPPTFTERRARRLALKRGMLEAFWNEAPAAEEAPMNLTIPPELRKKLDASYTLEADIAAVVEACERTGRKILDPGSGTFCGHLQIGPMTYWVEYRPAPGGGWELVNAYSHRMAIEEA
ncbi:MAG TPA: heterodisulfide reductase-related iron-sulfur binding cluster, partial [Holophaga sp.]|nr:heterodisulfide reductase-related iron-sulfur binding cluster [Holophaga sp.]